MYESVTVRFVQYVETHQVDRAELAEELGVSYSAISNIILGINNVSAKMQEKIQKNRPDIFEYMTGGSLPEPVVNEPDAAYGEDIADMIESLADLYTQNEMAEKLGISPQYLSDLKSGRRPATKRILRKMNQLQSDASKPAKPDAASIKEELEFIRTIVDRLIAKL